MRAGEWPVLARNDPLNIFGNQRQQTLPVAAAHCCKEILHNLNVLFCAHKNLSRNLMNVIIELFDHDSSVELDQVLKDQLTPAISARLNKQSAFRKPAKFDGRETEIFRKRTNLRRGAVIVARQEHDSPATMYGRILGKDGSDQMVEALNPLYGLPLRCKGVVASGFRIGLRTIYPASGCLRRGGP